MMNDEDDMKEVVLSLLKKEEELFSKNDILAHIIKIKHFPVTVAYMMFSDMAELGLEVCVENSSKDSRYNLRKFAEIKGW